MQKIPPQGQHLTDLVSDQHGRCVSMRHLTFTVCMEEDKQQRLLHLLLSLLQAKYASRQDVERLTGKLLWLSGPFAFLRPTLAPLYALQHSGQLVMAALTPEQWSNLRPLLNSDLVVTGSIGHPSVPVGSTLVRVARLPVSELAHIPAWLPESRRIWVASRQDDCTDWLYAMT